MISIIYYYYLVVILIILVTEDLLVVDLGIQKFRVTENFVVVDLGSNAQMNHNIRLLKKHLNPHIVAPGKALRTKVNLIFDEIIKFFAKDYNKHKQDLPILSKKNYGKKEHESRNLMVVGWLVGVG